MNHPLHVIPFSSRMRSAAPAAPRILLIGPYDPKGGEYTFLAPPLGVWRLCGVLRKAGLHAEVFDPNCGPEPADIALRKILLNNRWDIVGVSTTGMTLPHDLALAHLTRRLLPKVALVAGGMEATFNTEGLFALGPFDLAVLGEGEEPLVEIIDRFSQGSALEGVPGTAWRGADGKVQTARRPALTREGLSAAIFQTPYEQMPYRQYWEKLERLYHVGELPMKAEREARLAEIRSIRLITLNYCPMGCTFCSSTNFLNAAQGGTTAKVARLDEHESLAMIQRIVSAHPTVRTIIFQDDIFVFRSDRRVLPLCDGIIQAKRRGDLPDGLQFISTNRIDAMNAECLTAMRQAGFRVLGFGVESFSLQMLREFNKAQIYPFIAPVLAQALKLGITPFLDMILTSPRCQLADLAENVRQALRWVLAGCEVGMYPYVVPFSGAAMTNDATLGRATVFARRHIAGTGLSWNQAAKILPLDPLVRDTILEIESEFDEAASELGGAIGHLPSRVRSLLWIMSAIPQLERRGCDMPPLQAVEAMLPMHLPRGRTFGPAAAASALPMCAE